MKILLFLTLGLICGCMSLDGRHPSDVKYERVMKKNNELHEAGKISFSEWKSRSDEALRKYILPRR